MMKDEGFLAVSNLFDAGMEEHLSCSGCEPVGDALLRLVEVWHALQVPIGDLGCQVGLESEEEI